LRKSIFIVLFCPTDVLVVQDENDEREDKLIGKSVVNETGQENPGRKTLDSWTLFVSPFTIGLRTRDGTGQRMMGCSPAGVKIRASRPR
jgi:hypothetical protein